MAEALKNAIERYPNSGAARYWIDQYNWYQTHDGADPTTIQVHDIYQAYGGPEEGGWWYEVGQALATHCIFSKKQCIRRCIQLTEEYQLHNQPAINDTRNLSRIEARLDQGYARHYPEVRPRYE